MDQDKQKICDMVNDIYEQCVIDYLMVIVTDAYQATCSLQDLQRLSAGHKKADKSHQEV